MATKADLDLAVAAEQGDLTNILNAVGALVTEQLAAFSRLEALVAAGGTAADLAQEVTDVKAMSTAIQNALPAITAATAKAQAEGS